MAKKYRQTSKYGVSKNNGLIYLLAFFVIVALLVLLVIFVIGPYMENAVNADEDTAAVLLSSMASFAKF